MIQYGYDFDKDIKEALWSAIESRKQKKIVGWNSKLVEEEEVCRRKVSR